MATDTDKLEVTTDNLNTEGRSMSVVLSGNTITVTMPTTPLATAGALVLVSTAPFNPSNRPSDTALYTASTDISAPADTIGANGAAQVVGAFYNTLTIAPIVLTNMDPAKLYYVAAYAVSSVRQYAHQPELSYPLDVTRGSSASSQPSGDIPTSVVVPTNPKVGQVYYNPNSNSVFMWNGAVWLPAGNGTVMTGTKFPTNPDPGDFFFNTNTQDLDVWSGTEWIKSNTADQGIPMYAKEGVGTDGTSDERAELVNILMHQMGYPKICVELTEEHFDQAIDRALDEFRRRADNAYMKSYMLFDLLKGQQVYYLNDPTTGTNKTVDVIKVHRLSALGAYTSNDSGVYTQTFLNQIYSPSPVDMTSIHLLANLSKELERLFAGNFMFTWHETQRVLSIQRKIYRDEKVILECVQERTEQDLITDRWAKPWIQDWAHAKLLETLGYIRSKFGSLPGAGGGISLNGSELLNRADQKFEALKLQIDNFEVGNNSPDFAAPFMIG